MNKGNIVESVSAKTGETKAKTLEAVNAVLSVMKEGLAGGKKITLVGFGTFATAVRKERAGRNPKTGEAILIPEKIAVTFKAGSALKALVNGSKESADEAEAEETV